MLGMMLQTSGLEAKLTNFWIGSETQTPYIANFLCAIVVLILGIAVIKLFIRILNKTLKLDKKVIKERSVKVFISFDY